MDKWVNIFTYEHETARLAATPTQADTGYYAKTAHFILTAHAPVGRSITLVSAASGSFTNG